VNGPLSVWNSVDVSVVRAGVREIERQRGLRIGASPRADAGRRAAERALSVGADDKPDPYFAIGMCNRCTGVVDFHRERRSRNTRQVERDGMRIERREKMPVLDIVAECRQIDFGGIEHRLRRTNEPRVSSMMRIFLKRRGQRQARFPHAEGFERRYRTASSAVVR
jgi:hypothetical protein